MPTTTFFLIRSLVIGSILAFLASSCSSRLQSSAKEDPSALKVVQDDAGHTISVFAPGIDDPLVVQNARPYHRPYLHPIMAPDGNGSLTQYSPGHHRHQTGLYWGFTRVNGSGAPVDTLKKWFYRKDKPPRIVEMIGRDFFHHPDGGYWKRLVMKVTKPSGKVVQWQTEYHMLDAASKPMLKETQRWTMEQSAGKLILSLEWEGKAVRDIKINGFSYGGLFLRMPWHPGIEGVAINSAGQKNQEAESQPAEWVDVGMTIEGRANWGHIRILDHPSNNGFPQTWRVDGQLGVGPCRAIAGDWEIKKGKTEIIRHQLVVYTGEEDAAEMEQIWKKYSGE